MVRKKIMVCILSTLMGISTLAGCGSAQTVGTDTISSIDADSGDTVSTVSKTQEITASSVADSGLPSWEQDTSDCTVTWFLAYDYYGKKFDEVNNAFDKKLYEETGVKIEIQTGDTDKLNMLIQTGNLPDIVTLEANSTQRKLLETSGMVQPLETLMESYAPDLNMPQSMIDWYTAEDGHWYSIASYYYGEDNVAENNGYFETHNQNYVRDDILKQIGMDYDDLRTKQGFLAALRAVKEQNIQYNGQSVTPYLIGIPGTDVRIAQQMGGSEEDADGNFQSIYTTPQYRETMLLFNQMYSEGLLTDESFTMDSSQIEQEIAAGRVFATTGLANVQTSRDSLYAADNNAKMLYAGQFTGDTNDKIMVPAQNNMGWTATMISSNAKNPERIIRMFAYLSSKEATLDNVWGVGGWSLDEDGLVVRNQELKELQENSPTEFTAKYAGDFGWVSDYTIIQGTYPKDSGVWAEDTYLHTHDDRIIIYDEKCLGDVAPESGSEEAAIKARIDEYMKQALATIITAPSPEQCEAELDAALAELENLGLSKLIAYQNSLFQANKDKLGVEFVFPGNEK